MSASSGPNLKTMQVGTSLAELGSYGRYAYLQLLLIAEFLPEVWMTLSYVCKQTDLFGLAALTWGGTTSLV